MCRPYGIWGTLRPFVGAGPRPARPVLRGAKAARPGGRALQSVLQRAGGHTGPSLQLKRTTLITGSVPLIRLACGQPPYPFCPFGIFPPDRGNKPSPLGEGLAGG